MRKLFVAGAAVSATALVLAGCSNGGGGESTEGESSTVTVWMYPVIADEAVSSEFWDGIEAEFEAANEDIDLVIELQPWDNRDEKISTAIAANSGPNLVLLGADQALSYHDIGGLQPVTDGLDDSDAYLPGPVDAVTFDGEIYGVPIYQTATTTVYNRALFENAGISALPQTWDEILAAAPALAEQGVAVFDYSGSPELTLNLTFYPLLWQAGGSVFTEDGKDVAFDSPKGEAALQFLIDLQAAGGLPADAAVKSNAVEGGPLGNGTAAMGQGMNEAQFGQMVSALGEDAAAVGLPLKGVDQATFGTPGVLSLTTIDGNNEASLKAANFIASPDVAHRLNVAAANYPVREDVPAPNDEAVTEMFMDALEYAKPGEVVPNARQVMSVLAPNIQAALQGSKTAEQALADAAAEARAAIR